jgi:hypothetical protein
VWLAASPAPSPTFQEGDIVGGVVALALSRPYDHAPMRAKG